MSLYTKTLVTITSVLFAFVVFLSLVSQYVFRNSYSELEIQDVQEDVQRALNAVSDELAELSTENGDYAHWDDTYNFVQNPDDNYLENNYFVEMFQSQRLNLIVILNNQSEVLFSKAVNLDMGQEVAVSDDILQLFTVPNPLLDLSPAQDGSEGLLMTADGPMLISSQRIFTSQFEGPSMGLLIMGRLLNTTWIDQLSESLRLPVQLQAVDDRNLSAIFQTALANVTQENPIFVQADSDTQINGVAVMNDLYGTPALMLQLALPRAIYAQGQTSLSFLTGMVVVISLISIILVLLLVERLVLARLSRLSHTLSAVRETADFNQRMPVQGHDELAGLAADINATLQSLAHAQEALKQANDELEERVHTRTLELSATNLHLAEEITRHKNTQTLLLQARDEAVEALNFKSRILANMSHDARTPLSVISLRTEMLMAGRYGSVTEKQIETLEGILTSARQLLGFITNLLQEAQLQAKSLTIKSIPFQLSTLLKAVEATVSPLTEQKGLSFKTELSPDVPDMMLGDAERLNQILMNLIGNAIKFTDKGGISVKTFCQDEQHWGLQVSDTGIGISEEAQGRIFEAFWQVNDSMTLSNGQGVGLGLSIVKELVTLMGGKISVNSQTSQGTRFTIVLPIQRLQQKMADEALVHSS